MRTTPRRKSGGTNKMVALVALVVQTTFTVIMMQYSRLEADTDTIRYAPTTAVATAEFCKWVFAMVVIMMGQAADSKLGDAGMGPIEYLYEKVYSDPWDYAKVSVPGICYMVQNNLLFVALSNLDSAVYQVVYQLKVLSTAIFSVTMLYDPLTGRRRTLSKMQWLALVFLMAGAAITQLSSQQSGKESTHLPDRNPTLGLAACIGACVISGFAGVWFERVLKPRPDAAEKREVPTLWVRNVQLASFGFLSALVSVYFKDWDHVVTHGFFGGYTRSTWVVIVSNTFGGFLVAIVVKQTSQVVKAFANGLSIILGVICAVFLFEFQITSMFFLGAILVLLSLVLYNSRKK